MFGIFKETNRIEVTNSCQKMLPFWPTYLCTWCGSPSMMPARSSAGNTKTSSFVKMKSRVLAPSRRRLTTLQSIPLPQFPPTPTPQVIQSHPPSPPLLKVHPNVLKFVRPEATPEAFKSRSPGTRTCAHIAHKGSGGNATPFP